MTISPSIRTRYGNSHITARSDSPDARTLRVAYDYALNADENHRAAALLWIERYGDDRVTISDDGVWYGDATYWPLVPAAE